MSDILISSKVLQSSSSPTMRRDFYLGDNIIQGTSQACLIDTTPPVFAGIAAVEALQLGAIRVNWLAASDPTPPIRYEVYAKAGTSSGLFNTNNIVMITDKLIADIFALADGSFLKPDVVYYFGVRALDGVSNRDNNLATLNTTTPGITAAEPNYTVQGAFSIDTQNRLRGSLWGLKNGVLVSGSALGQASYTVYTKDGTILDSMTEASLVADSNGIFKITPKNSAMSYSLDHYVVKVSIVMDGGIRTGFVPIVEQAPVYEVHGVFSLDTENKMRATFWTTANDELITTGARLGTASYQVYDKTGAAVVGMSESGLTADSNGYYKITPVASQLVTDLAHYVVKVTATVDNISRTNTLPIMGKVPTYAIKGAFSISTANQLCGTIWALMDSGLVTGSSLGTASYTIYDKTGAAIGMTESGIAADGNGQFKITPVTSLLNQTLNHYLVKVTVSVDGVSRSDYISVIEQAPVYEVHGVCSIDTSNQFQAAFWATANDEQVSSGSRLGAASYQVYDQSGAAVSGMSGSGITADANGYFKITPVASLLVTDLAHYMVKVTIVVDGIGRISTTQIAGHIPTYELRGAFSLNKSNQLQGTIWGLKNSGLVIGASLGTASYTIYDRAGSAVGMTESGMTADGNGQYRITPVTNLMEKELNHYLIKVTATVDGSLRTSYIPIIERIPQYDIGGVFSIDGQSRLIGSIWGMDDSEAILDVSRLGVTSYTIYDAAGAPVGMSESGLTPGSNGVYVITPTMSMLCPILTHYAVKVTMVIDGITRMKYLPIAGKYPSYEAKGQFSINAANQFQGTLWATVDGVVAGQSSLGTASYAVYDLIGTLVSGLSQSGLVADVNGRFAISPASASILTDLTHYSVKIAIMVNGYERVSYRGFTLLGN